MVVDKEIMLIIEKYMLGGVVYYDNRSLDIKRVKEYYGLSNYNFMNREMMLSVRKGKYVRYVNREGELRGGVLTEVRECGGKININLMLTLKGKRGNGRDKLHWCLLLNENMFFYKKSENVIENILQSVMEEDKNFRIRDVER